MEFKIKDEITEGDYKLYAKVYKKGGEKEVCVENSEETIELKEIKICSQKSDDIKIKRITDLLDENEKEWEWKLRNNIKLEADILNEDSSEEDFTLELILLDKNNNQVSLAKEQGSITEELNLKKNKNSKVQFEFEVNPELIGEEFTLYGKLYSKNNNNICTSLKAEEKDDPVKILILRKERDVLITEADGPNELNPGSDVTYNAKITNMGEKSEEKVMAVLYNKLMDLRLEKEVSNLNSGDTAEVQFQFTVPENITPQNSYITFSTEFNYNSGSYKELSEDYIKHHIKILEYKKPVEEAKTNQTNKTDNSLENLTAELSQNNQPSNLENPLIETNTQENFQTDSNPTITGAAIKQNSKEKSSSGKTTIIIILSALVIGVAVFIFAKRKPKKRFTGNTLSAKHIRIRKLSEMQKGY
jgi:hypothetical protein